ncbi:MAG: PEP/pyruvate-binding domain-containing protein [Pseudomonadota bacterium]
MAFKSQALEANVASYHVDVDIDAKYAPIQEAMAKYYGLTEGLNTFLKELSHPYRNWRFIVNEARGYALDYFHLLRQHPDGPDAMALFVEVFLTAITTELPSDIHVDAVDNLQLYLQKVLKEAGPDLFRFAPVVDSAFERFVSLPEPLFALLMKSYFQLPRLAALIADNPDGYRVVGLTTIMKLLQRYYENTYDYWLSENDPLEWFLNEVQSHDDAPLREILLPVSHQKIRTEFERLKAILATGENDVDSLKAMVDLKGFGVVVDHYRRAPGRIMAIGRLMGQGNQWKVIFLFHMMSIPGLSAIHEETLRDINRTLTGLIGTTTHRHIRQLIERTFGILKSRVKDFPATALNCVSNMGKGVIKTDDSELINFFIDRMIDLGFQAPMIGGVGNDWQVKMNPAHIQNIRTWLELIELNPKYSPRLLSYLTIHLALCGVFIKDTDLFPRDITRFLNSGIGPVYNLAKQLARLFPVYFNDIGAEGALRDISTELDEIVHRRDVLIHFLRKQCHVESSNLAVKFMEATLAYWQTGDKRLVEPYVPPSIYEGIDPNGPYAAGVRIAVAHVSSLGYAWPRGVISLDEAELTDILKGAAGATPVDCRRIVLLIQFYKMLYQKYNLDFIEMDNYLAQLHAEAFPDLDRLRAALASPGTKEKLNGLIDFLERLKTIAVSDTIYEVREDIYKKRHFTVDIPSMYGRYHETKFDALGLTFRLESVANVLFEQRINDIDLSLITKATFYQIYNRLMLFDRALKLDGISSVEIERQLDLLAHSLEVRGFTFTQYLDIFKGFAQAVKNIINDYFNNIHEQNLTRILSQLPPEQLLPKFLPPEGKNDPEQFQHRVSEVFFRDRIALSLGLQQLDTFLSRILNTLFHQSDRLPTDKLQLLLNYDPQRAMTSIASPKERVNSIIYLGNKGQNMVKLREYNLPVPPGFIITTEAFRCKAILESYSPAEQNFKDHLSLEIQRLEQMTGKNFGDPENPLLFSVRSGSAISQPGMMDTFLNVGLNIPITEGLARRTGNTWFAWDSYRRFLQCYGMAFGLQRNDFDAVISAFKQRLGIPLKKGFAGEQMKAVALAYRELIQDDGIDIVDEPFDQLYMTIKSVFDSWYSPKARTYRRIMGISDDWGTAVTVQEMVFGNLSSQSGTGVFFTHNPRWSGDILKLWGDFTIANQGEDVVSGLVTTLPISLLQQETEMRDTDITLETHFPKIYDTLKTWANELIYTRGWSPQEMEFTFESPTVEDLYLLQTRDMAMRERKRVMTYDHERIDEEQFLGHGIAVSGGAMNGRVVFTLQEIDDWRVKEPDTHLILVRGDTVPDDIREIYAADGLLTARGGVTSHAAVVAHRLEKTCVVGCGNLVVNEKKRSCSFDGKRLDSGAYISVDGQEGSVYQGHAMLKEA